MLMVAGVQRARSRLACTRGSDTHQTAGI